MKQDFDYNNFIERYLKREMEPDERIWFEKEVEGNLTLKKEIALHKKVDTVLADNELVELKIQLDQIHKEIFEVTEKGKGAIRKIYRRVYYTASALALFAILFSVFMSNRNFSNEKLVELYYQPKQTTAYRSPGTENISEKAMEYYNAKNYSMAIPLFKSILKIDKNNNGLFLYTGISNLEVKNYGEANRQFKAILDNKPNPFVESATWYLGLSYLMTGESEKATHHFEELKAGNGFYSKDAGKILRRIK